MEGMNQNQQASNQSGMGKWLKAAIAAVAVYLAIRFLLPLFLPFCVAGLLAMLLYPMARLLHRYLRIPIFASGAFTLIVFLCGIVWALFRVGRILLNQLIAFFQNFEIYEAYLAEQVDGICNGCDKIFRLESGTVMGVLESAMAVLMDRVQSDILPALTAKTLKFAAGTAAILGVALIVLVSTLLMIKDMEDYKKTIQK